MNPKHIDEMIKEISNYADLGDDEMSEAIHALIGLYSFKRDYISAQLVDAIIKELSESLSMYRQRCRIVERSETYERKWKELEWV